jgi:hypothetical protein
MSNQKSHIIFRLFKVLGWLVFFLALTAVATRYSLKTAPVHQLAKKQVISFANNQLLGTVSIGKIEGDLWKDFSIHKIQVTSGPDTLIYLNKVSITYNIWSLLGESFIINGLHLNDLHTNIKEEQNGEFNLQKLIKADDSTPADDSGESVFSINLQHIDLQNSALDIWAPSYLPDNTLEINELHASGGFQLSDEISGNLSSLSFRITEGRLPEPISFELSATYQSEIITLSQIILGTGRSVISANARTNLSDSTVTAELNAHPFSIKDIEPYLRSQLINNELDISISARGKFDSLDVKLLGEGTGFDKLDVSTNFTLSETPSVNNLSLSVENIDLGYFTNDSLQAQIGKLQAAFEGSLPQDPAKMNISWNAEASTLQYDNQVLDSFSGSGSVSKGVALANFQARSGVELMSANASIRKLFSEQPEWDLFTSVNDLDLGQWIQDDALNTDINFQLMLRGKGYELSNEPWTFEFKNTSRAALVSDTISVNGQKFAGINLSGSLTQKKFETSGFVKLIKNKIDLSAIVYDFMDLEKASYEFSAATQQFDAREIYGVENFPTSINLKTTGSGTSFDSRSLQIRAQLLVDSSVVNGAAFDSLGIEANYQNSILRIPIARLRSDLIDGSFSARRNIYDVTDPENDISLDVQIKNLQPLASLLGATVFNSTGQITGNITNETPEKLRFDGNVDLADVVYDTLFTARSISGRTNVLIGEQFGYDTSLELTEPTFNGFELEDILLTTKGLASADTIAGSFNFDIASTDAGQISQSGTYHLLPASFETRILWNKFDFRTPERTLSLQQPFQLHYQDASIQTDSLLLLSPGGTYLNLAIPYADSLRQEVWVTGQDFDFGTIQEIIFDERFIDGILSGSLSIYNSPDKLFGNGRLDFTQLSYRGTDIDSLDLNFDLQNERLNAHLRLAMNGEEKVYGNLDIPFIPADPVTLEDAFFDEPVQGKLVVNPVQLSEFQSLLNSINITQTDGIFGFNGQLSGTVSEPNIEGLFSLGKPTLSGIRIDSAFAEFRYDHHSNSITTSAEINASNQKAAQINARVPLSVDFRTFAITMPNDDDSLQVNIITDNFNISVFNDFLDEQYTNRLRGILNAELNLSGPLGSLSTDGFLTLHSGQLGIPVAGITLSSINSELRFTEKGLELQNFSMKSGNGVFTASGTIKLDGISPTNVDISTQASRFRAANTDDYNLTVDMNSRLSGNPLRPTLSGDLAVKNGFIFLQDFGERSVESVTLDEEELSSFSPYDSLAIDMRFEIERNFLVRNRRYLDLEIALTGELDAQKKTGSDLQLFGTLNAERGYARPLGKQFNLDEGNFTFSGPVTEPDVFIRTSYIPRTAQKQTGDPITLFYIIEGNASDPGFRFESEPFMEQQDIICYTLFNKPCYALESWQQVVSGGSGSSPTDLLVDVLLNEVETLATQQLGIDVVQIDNSGSDGKTSIKTGWYLNRRTFFAIINEISGTTPETLFILEYILSENLDVVITQGDDNRQGIDLRWQYDY